MILGEFARRSDVVRTRFAAGSGPPETGRSSGCATVQLQLDTIPDIWTFSYAELDTSSDARAQSPGAMEVPTRLESVVRISNRRSMKSGTRAERNGHLRGR
ncbi:hypothetical protein C480_18452 [Natrialba aegyptia DSM 13077]|uniref:Uncharacterized protein n=1 Tax=Natrialba aegyptia DSM 13077 TaxID=1227491 RepID=M0AU49_9EURY|nr:hypothetical protein C480_18452 [Natrialba aegyptia DSM 13077]